MSFPASTLSGALSRVTLRIARLPTTFIAGSGCPGTAKPSSCGVISVTPGAFFRAAVTAPTLSTETTTWVGSPSPPGKCFVSNFCPTTDSGFPVKVSTVPIPSAFSVVDANAKSRRTDPEITQALRGLRSMELPTFDHVPEST